MSSLLSSDNGEAPSAHNALVNTNLITEESVPCGLETIAMAALQELRKERGKKEGIAAMSLEEGLQIQDRKNSTDKGTIAINRTFPTRRIVSVGCSWEPRVEEKETLSSTKKASSIPLITALTSVDDIIDAVGPSSSTYLSSLPPSSTTTSNDKVKDTLISTKEKEDCLKVDNFSEILSNPEGWLQRTENMFAKLPPLDHKNDEIMVQPNDVLCGRGGETNHHPGNVKYRSLVKVYQKLYLLAKRRDKPKIAQCIVVSVRGVNGRFLKRMKDSKKMSIWVDVGNVKAREKTSQALREGAPDLRETVNTSPNTNNPGNHVLAQERKEANIVSSSAMPLPTFDTLCFNNSWQTAKFNSADSTRNANRPTSPVSSSSSSPTSTQSYTDTNQAFTTATAKLMQHPMFRQLDATQQHQAILYELRTAQATALETAKRTSTTIQGTAPSMTLQQYDSYWRHCLSRDIGKHKTSGIADFKIPAPIPSSDITPPLLQKYHLPPSEASVASYGTPTISALQHNGEAHTTSTVTTKEHNHKTNMRSAAVPSQDYVNYLFCSTPLNGHTSNTKKRPAPHSSAPSIVTSMNSTASKKGSHSTSQPTIVSDTGSESSSLSASSCSSDLIAHYVPLKASINSSSDQILSSNSTATEDVKDTIVPCHVRRGSRLKRFKLRACNTNSCHEK